MESGITEAELLEELQAALGQNDEAPEGAMTGPEIFAALGVSSKTGLPIIRRLIREGRIAPCRIPIVNSVGVKTSTWGYRLAA